MDKVSHMTSKKRPLDEFSMVMYNNLLSIPLLLVLMLYFGEFKTLGRSLSWPGNSARVLNHVLPTCSGCCAAGEQRDLYNFQFQLAAFMSGIIGFSISFASLWFLSTTTPTVYSLVGSLNKIPVAFLGADGAARVCWTGILRSVAIPLAPNRRHDHVRHRDLHPEHC